MNLKRYLQHIKETKTNYLTVGELKRTLELYPEDTIILCETRNNENEISITIDNIEYMPIYSVIRNKKESKYLLFDLERSCNE